MKTDMIILKVVDKVKRDHGIKYRKRSIDEKGKTFLERYAAYAITNVRKTLMQNLKRNAPTKKNGQGKRVKKNRLATTLKYISRQRNELIKEPKQCSWR